MMDKNKVLTISVPASLYKDLEEAMQRAGCDDVNEFVSLILVEHLGKAEEYLNNEETKILKERLKGLGYI